MGEYNRLRLHDRYRLSCRAVCVAFHHRPVHRGRYVGDMMFNIHRLREDLIWAGGSTVRIKAVLHAYADEYPGFSYFWRSDWGVIGIEYRDIRLNYDLKLNKYF